MKHLLILILIYPLTSFSQIEDVKYKKVIDFVIDSIVKNDTNNFYISNLIERRTEFTDFHGISSDCEIQHKLLLEILMNGEQSKKMESDITPLILSELNNKAKKNKIELITIISYQKIWATVIAMRDIANRENKWFKYSLIFVDNKLIGQMVGEWNSN